MVKRRGQSTLEYIVLITAVIVTIILFVGSDNSPFKQGFNNTLKGSMNGMNKMGGYLGSSL